MGSPCTPDVKRLPTTTADDVVNLLTGVAKGEVATDDKGLTPGLPCCCRGR